MTESIYKEYENKYYNPNDNDKKPGDNDNWKSIQKGFHDISTTQLETSAGLTLGKGTEDETSLTAVELKNMKNAGETLVLAVVPFAVPATGSYTANERKSVTMTDSMKQSIDRVLDSLPSPGNTPYIVIVTATVRSGVKLEGYIQFMPNEGKGSASTIYIDDNVSTFGQANNNTVGYHVNNVLLEAVNTKAEATNVSALHMGTIMICKNKGTFTP